MPVAISQPLWYRLSMKLKDYMTLRKLTTVQMAAQLGVSHVAVVRYTTGGRVPTPKIMRKIIEVTGGEVRPDDFFACRISLTTANDTYAPGAAA